MAGPISPDQLKGQGPAPIPEFVIEAMNELLGEKWNSAGGIVNVTIDEFVGRIKEKLAQRDIPDATIKDDWLEIEPHYREAHWVVDVVNTGWNNPAPNYFTFTAKK